jgi:hypothetical protein
MNALKSSGRLALHLFKPAEPTLHKNADIAKVDRIFSSFFLISAIAVIILVAAYGRCSIQANQVGTQDMSSDDPRNCNNLLFITCFDVCGKTYGTSVFNGDTYSNKNVAVQGYMMSVNIENVSYYGGEYSRLNSGSSAGFCNAGKRTLYTFNTSGPSPWYFASTSHDLCTAECKSFPVGKSVTVRTVGSYSNGMNLGLPESPFVTVGVVFPSADCLCSEFKVSQASLPSCACSDAVNTNILPAVVNSKSCQTSYSYHGSVPAGSGLFVNTYSQAPLMQTCEGTLKEVRICVTNVSLIGVIGGYLSLLFTIFTVAFKVFVSLVLKKIDSGSSDSSDEEEEEIDLTGKGEL